MNEVELLNKRISEVESQIFKAKIYGGAFAFTLLAVFGITWTQISGIAKTVATSAVEGSVLDNVRKVAQAKLKDIEQTADKAEAAAIGLAAIEEAARKTESAAGRAKNAAESAEANQAKLSGQLSPSTWPHAINCGSETTFFILHGAPKDMKGKGIALYVQVHNDNRDYRTVRFNGDGSYLDRIGHLPSSALCEGKSISQLRLEGRTYQFIAR